MNKKDKLVFALVCLAQATMIILRIGLVINWHWAWVLAPILFCAALFVLIVLVAAFAAGIQGLLRW